MILNTPKVEVSYRYETVGDNPVTIYADGAPSISMTADSELKITFRGSFHDYRTLNVDFITDELHAIVTINGNEYSLGYYIITSESLSAEDGITTIAVEGYSRLYLLKQSKIEARVYFAAGTLYTDALYALLTAAGITNYNMTASTLTLATDREDWEVGTDRLTIINTLLSEMAYNSVYVDHDGKIQLTPTTEATAANVGITYLADRYSIISPDFTIQNDRHGKPNVFMVICSNPDLAAPLTSMLENNSADNPYSTVYRPRVLSVTKIDNIASQTALDDYTYNLMVKSLLSDETVSFETMLNPEHTVNNILALGNGDLSGIYAETGWTMTLDGGAVMTHTARRSTGYINGQKIKYTSPSWVYVDGYVLGGKTTTLKWTAPTVSETITGYVVESSVDGGAFTQVYSGTSTTFNDSLTFGTETVQYQIKAVSGDESSQYITTAVYDVINSNDPVISGTDTDLGTVSEIDDLTYTVTNPDESLTKTLTVDEKVDSTLIRTYSATSGSTYTASIPTATWNGLADGTHTLTVTATDTYGGTTIRTYTFTKSAASYITAWTTMIAEETDAPYKFGSGTSFCIYNGVLYCAVSRVNISPYIKVYYLSSGSWVDMGALPSTPAGQCQDCSLCVNDGILYLAAARESSTYVYTWYLSGGSWVYITAPSTLPTGTCWGCSLASLNNVLYMSFVHENSPYATTYYLSAGVWVKIANPATLPSSKGYSCALYVFGSEMYLTVTTLSSPYINIYKWVDSTWSAMTVGTALTTTAHACAFCEFGGELYLTVSTMDVSFSYAGHMSTYKLTDGTWVSAASILTLGYSYAPTSCRMCAFNGCLYLAVDGWGTPPNTRMQKFGEGSWSAFTPALPSSEDMSDGTMIVFDSKLYLVMGTLGGTTNMIICYGE